MIKQLLRRRIASDNAVARFGQVVCFGGACLIPVVVCRKFATLELTEAELITGALGTMSMALLCAVHGVLLEPKGKAAQTVSGPKGGPDEARLIPPAR